MPRRGTNIYKRKDGRWEGRISQNNREGEARKYISVYGKTYTEVKNKMEQLRREGEKSKKVYPMNLDEAVNLWLSERVSYWKPTTYAAYKNITDKYIVPRLGKTRVLRVNNQVMEKFVSDIRFDDEGKQLSNSYLHNICSILIMVLNHMKKRYHYEIELPENPISKARQGQMLLPSERDMSILEKYLIEHASDSTCLGVLIAFYTGIRIGELCALTWEDINLDEEVLYVRKNVQRVKNSDSIKNNTEILFQKPKTDTSMRSIPLPPVLLPLLKLYKDEDTKYVVKGKKSPWAEPRTLQYRFSGILKQCSIKNFRFHMLRHAFATRCIAKGFDVKSLSEILGHSSVQITLNLYVHSTMQRKKQLMNLFSFYLYEEKTSAV